MQLCGRDLGVSIDPYSLRCRSCWFSVVPPEADNPPILIENLRYNTEWVKLKVEPGKGQFSRILELKRATRSLTGRELLPPPSRR